MFGLSSSGGSFVTKEECLAHDHRCEFLPGDWKGLTNATKARSLLEIMSPAGPSWRLPGWSMTKCPTGLNTEWKHSGEPITHFDPAWNAKLPQFDSVFSVQVCGIKCAENAACVGFTVDGKENQCYLKSSWPEYDGADNKAYPHFASQPMTEAVRACYKSIKPPATNASLSANATGAGRSASEKKEAWAQMSPAEQNATWAAMSPATQTVSV